jgi:hypothetical protein
LEVSEVEIFFGLVGRQIYEVREVEKFFELRKSESLGGLERFCSRNYLQNLLARNTRTFNCSFM